MTQPQPGQVVKLRRRFGRGVNVFPHHGDLNGVTSVVEVTYRDPWTHPEPDKVIWHLEKGTGAKVIPTLTPPNPIEGQADDPVDMERMVDACRWAALERLPDWSPDPLERPQHTPRSAWSDKEDPDQIREGMCRHRGQG